MIWYVIRRLGVCVLLMLGLLTLSFSLVAMLPGSPSVALLGEYASPEAVAELNAQLGLDKPFFERYLDYIGGAITGDFGRSFYTGRPVFDDLMMRVPNTLVYLIPGLAMALIGGIIAGTAAAYRYRRPVDRVFTVWLSVVLAVPEFVLALLLIVVFFTILGVSAPPIGMVSASDAMPPEVTGSLVVDAVLAGYWGTFGSILWHAVLPIVTVGVFFSAPFAKIVRNGMVQALASPQIEFARACGLLPRQVFGYAMADIRGSVMTYFVILLASSLSGAAIVENVFSWPGIGGWALNGVLANDMPVIQGFIVVMGAASLLGYVVLDVATTLLDPRTRLQLRHKREPRGAAHIDKMNGSSVN